MIWRKKYLLFLAVFGLALFLGLALVKLGDFDFVSAQGTLSCEVRDYACGDTKPVEVFQMYSTSNSHAALPVQSYGNYVCCGGITDLGNDCDAGNKEVVLKLSGTTNAHARQNSYGDYSGSKKVCISAPSGNVINVGYVAGNSTCAAGGYQTTLGSMSKDTNAHVGNEAAYTGASNYKICAKITAEVVYSISLNREEFFYGKMGNNSASSTFSLWDGAGITATNGEVPANLYIYGAPTGGGKGFGGWNLTSATAEDEYVHKFCNDTEDDCDLPVNEGNYTPLTTSPQLLKSSVAPGGTVTFQLQITTPNPTTVYETQSVVVTVQASE